MAAASAPETKEAVGPPEAMTSSTPADAAPPDGGVRAWTQALGSFVLYFNTWGLVASFGTFQAIYEIDPKLHASPFQISVIGSLQTFLMVFLGLVTGPIYDAGYFRHLLTAGSVLVVVGTLLQSFCVSYWQLLLAQGLAVGLGAGCLCLLGVVVPSLWFTRRLPVANAIAASGSGIGGVVLPIMVREIHLRVGVGWASRSLCFVFLALLGLSNMILRDRRPPGKRKTRSLVDPAAFRDWPYLLFVLGCCVVFLGIYTPFVHIQSFTLQQDIASPSLSLYILSILNASSILGRILPNLITNRVGPLNMIIITSLALSASTFGLLAVSDLAPLLVVAVVFGFFTGTFFSLMPTIFVRLSPDPAMIGTRFGMAFAAMSVPLLFGPPIAGALFGEKAGYHGSWIWAGAVMAVGGGVILGSRILKARVLSTQGSGIMTVL